MKVKKRNNIKLRTISANKIYKVISIEYDTYRLLNEEGEPFLYEIKFFEVVDSAVEQNWVIEIDEEDDSIIYLGPKEFKDGYFFEDYFDDKEEIKNIFLNWLEKEF